MILQLVQSLINQCRAPNGLTIPIIISLFSNNLISTDTYAWELSAQITLPPAQGSYSGNRTMNITLQKTESLSIETDSLQEHLENYTPIGSYKNKIFNNKLIFSVIYK